MIELNSWKHKFIIWKKIIACGEKNILNLNHFMIDVDMQQKK